MTYMPTRSRLLMTTTVATTPKGMHNIHYTLLTTEVLVVSCMQLNTPRNRCAIITDSPKSTTRKNC